MTLRALLQDAVGGAASPPPPVSTTVGTGEPGQTIPSTASVVGGVVGGLSALTLCLAAALVFAVARIYGWRLTRLFARKGGGGGKGWQSQDNGSPTKSKQSDVQDALEQGRAASMRPLPSIVTSRLARDSGTAAEEEEALSHRNNLNRQMSKISQLSGVSSPDRSFVASPLRTDASWKDCLIEAEKIQILRRRDGKPWVLGGGAFGQVFKALYDGVQVVAAKVLTGLEDERIFRAFAREAAILREMRDRNIVQFVGVCLGSEEEGQPNEAMLIQEFMEAGSLYQALKWHDQAGRRVFGWYARGKRAACDIARGLHYLHAHKTVHLDVKSSNVLLARDGTCKVADVGLARNLLTKTLLTEAGTMGTFAWSAPEVLTGQPCGTPADIYSFGIVLWEIVTGEIPNRGTMRNPMVPSECRQEVLDLIDRCTAQDPKARPTAKQIVQLLEGMAEGTPSQAEARGAPLRSASLAVWRDTLPQQVSVLGTPPTSPPLTGNVPEGDEGSPRKLLLSSSPEDDEDLAALAEREELEAAERVKRGAPPPAPPMATLRLEDLPPLSEADQMFK